MAVLREEVREPRLRERIAVRLAAEIISGQMLPGSVFPSAEEIVQRFGVSRTVARETVHTLSMLGLVHVQHGKRSEVLPADKWDILSGVVQEAVRREQREARYLRDLYEFRLLVEPAAVRLTAERGPDRDIQELDRLARTMADLAEETAVGAETRHPDSTFHAADWDFHHLVARASGNVILGAIIRDLREVLVTLWSVSRLDADEIARVAKQHSRVAAAIRVRDADAAAEAMRDHLSWASALDLRRLGGQDA